MGEVLSCKREPTNSRDRYAVAVKKDKVAIGHLFRKVLSICSLFLRRGSAIHCKVSGEIACGCCHAMIASLAAYLTLLLRAVLLVWPTLLVTGCRFCHFAIRNGYSPQRNGKRGQSLGVRKPISLFFSIEKKPYSCPNWMTVKNFC